MPGANDPRDPNGRWLKGVSANPGGLSRRQKAVVRLLEGLTPKAAKTLSELLDDPDPQIRLGAAKEIIGRVAPPPPRPPSATVNIAMGSSAGHMGALVAIAERRVAMLAAEPANAVDAASVEVAAEAEQDGADE